MRVQAIAQFNGYGKFRLVSHDLFRISGAQTADYSHIGKMPASWFQVMDLLIAFQIQLRT